MDYISELYKEYVVQNADSRVANLPLMNSPKITIYCIILYLIFVKIVGPLHMKNREPSEIKKWIIIYNGFQTIFSFTMVLMAIKLAWIFFISRFLQFTDTIFLVLKKKNNDISLLHVVYHAAVPLICWIGLKVEPAGHYVLAGGINTFVHAFMCFYYMILAMGPEYKQYLWEKKYLTILQLAQFVLIFSHVVWTILSECPVNKFIGYLVLFQEGLLFNLSLDFYKESFGYSNLDLNSLVNYEKFYSKYKKFFEMCIPDQNALMADDDKED